MMSSREFTSTPTRQVLPRRVEGFWLHGTSTLSPGTSSLLSSPSLHNSTPHIPKPPHTAQLIIFLLSHYFSREIRVLLFLIPHI